MNGINAWLSNASVGTSVALALLVACGGEALEQKHEASGTLPAVTNTAGPDGGPRSAVTDAATRAPSDAATTDAAADAATGGGKDAGACVGLDVTDCIAACGQDVDCIVACAGAAQPGMDPDDCMP